jgi:hypothetical protein
MLSLYTLFFNIKQYRYALEILIPFITELYVGCTCFESMTILPVSDVGMVNKCFFVCCLGYWVLFS